MSYVRAPVGWEGRAWVHDDLEADLADFAQCYRAGVDPDGRYAPPIATATEGTN